MDEEDEEAVGREIHPLLGRGGSCSAPCAECGGGGGKEEEKGEAAPLCAYVGLGQMEEAHCRSKWREEKRTAPSLSSGQVRGRMGKAK